MEHSKGLSRGLISGIMSGVKADIVLYSTPTRDGQVPGTAHRQEVGKLLPFLVLKREGKGVELQEPRES